MFSVEWSTRLKDWPISFLFPCRHIVSQKHSNSSQAFSLIYEAEIVGPTDLIVTSARLALTTKSSYPHDRIYNVEALKESKQHRKQMAILSETY